MLLWFWKIIGLFILNEMSNKLYSASVYMIHGHFMFFSVFKNLRPSFSEDSIPGHALDKIGCWSIRRSSFRMDVILSYVKCMWFTGNFSLMLSIVLNYPFQLYIWCNEKTRILSETLRRPSLRPGAFWSETSLASRSQYTVKPVISGHLEIHKTKILMENDSLMEVESIAECSPWSILQYFWPE